MEIECLFKQIGCKTVSTEDAAPPKYTKSRNYNSSVRIQIKSKFESVPRDTKESEFCDLVDFGGAAFSVETVITDAQAYC